MKDGWQTFVDLTKAKAGSHMKTARYWESVHNTFSLSLIFLGAITTGLALINGIPPMVLAAIAGVSTLLSTVSAFLRPGDRKAEQAGSSKEFRSMMLRMVMVETEKDYEQLWKELNKAIVDEPMVPKKYLTGLKIDWTMTPQFMLVIDEKDKELEAALGSSNELREDVDAKEDDENTDEKSLLDETKV